MIEGVLADGTATAARSAPQRVITGVLEHIRARGLTPGDVLPSEQVLGSTFGASRAVVRHALAALGALQMVEISNGRNARVGYINHTILAMMLGHAVDADRIGIAHFIDARRAVEVRAASLAALRRNAPEVERLIELCGDMRASLAAPLRLMDHDMMFHETIADASRNPMLALLTATFQFANRRAWPLGWAGRRSQTERQVMVAIHVAIAQAIEQRDPRAAESAMNAHFDLAADAMLAGGAD